MKLRAVTQEMLRNFSHNHKNRTNTMTICCCFGVTVYVELPIYDDLLNIALAYMFYIDRVHDLNYINYINISFKCCSLMAISSSLLVYL